MENSSETDPQSHDTRVERDSMGSMLVPRDALWGASTERARLNFPIGGAAHRFSSDFIASLALAKLAAARANHDLGLLDSSRADAIVDACREIMTGKHDEHFVVSVFQTGSGTSTNMNANEVITSLVRRLHTVSVHPNDHVNMGQSSNDVIPSVIHITLVRKIAARLMPALARLSRTLGGLEKRHRKVVKTGRTHLQDATPVTFGQVFGGFKAQVDEQKAAIRSVSKRLSRLALGGTAVGSGINTPETFAARAIRLISRETGLQFREAKNHFAAQGAIDTLVEAAGVLQTTSTALHKIANDLRWMASGPRAGLNEIYLPATQPGSSIMPAKTNPVMCEALMQVCYRVMGNSQTVAFAAQASNFELNVALPVVAHSLLESLDLLADGVEVFVERCLKNARPTATGPALVARGLALCTALAPVIGYEAAASVAKAAAESDETILEVASRLTALDRETLARLLDPLTMSNSPT